MGYKDPEQQRKYQRERNARIRQEWLADKCCVKCSSTDRLEVDHIDRATKVSHNVWSWAPAWRAAELAKCQVLCHQHHWEKTHAERVALRGYVHGNPSGYRRGCRCEPCRIAYSAARRAHHLRTGQ